MRCLRGEWGRKRTLNEARAEREGGLNYGPEHESLLSAVEICKTAKEEEKAPGAKGKCGDEPLKLVGGDSKVTTDGGESNGRGGVRRSLRVGSG